MALLEEVMGVLGEALERNDSRGPQPREKGQ
jgi:hypothetical protein